MPAAWPPCTDVRHCPSSSLQQLNCGTRAAARSLFSVYLSVPRLWFPSICASLKLLGVAGSQTESGVIHCVSATNPAPSPTWAARMPGTEQQA